LSEEALVLGQALDVPASVLADLFVIRAIGFAFSNQNDEAIAAAEYSAKLAERAGDSGIWARALLNLSNMLHTVDPAAAATAARMAADHARRTGARGILTIAVTNLVYATLVMGDWDAAEESLTRAMHGDGLDDDEYMHSGLALLAALRGDVETAAAHSGLPALRVSDDAQDLASAEALDAFLAAASGRHSEALHHSRAVLGYADAIGMRHELTYWAWPLAVRSAFLIGDTSQVVELLALLDGRPVGHLPPILRAERALAQARLAAAQGGADVTAGFDDAIAQLRSVGSPYHLAHALIDLGEFQGANGSELDVLLDEAVSIAGRLGAQPLLDRAAATRAARSEVPAR
jgi:tetratricopeptide (TPR) repeat protein